MADVISARERQDALARLAGLVENRRKELEEKPVSGTAIEEVGQKVYNRIVAKMAHTLPPKKLRKAIIALAFRLPDMNEAMVLAALVRTPACRRALPRRREASYRQRCGIVVRR